MLSIRSAGLVVLDPSLVILDFNQQFITMLGERLITPGTRMSSLVQDGNASVLSLVAAHLARPESDTLVGPPLRRFIMGLSFTAGAGPAVELPAEIFWCPAPHPAPPSNSPAPGGGGAAVGSAAGDGACVGAGQPAGAGFLVVFCSPVLDVGKACTLRAVLSVLGFRPGETRAVFRLARTPHTAPPRPDPSRRRRAGATGGAAGAVGAGGGCGIGIELLPSYAKPCAMQFLLRGLRDGDWSGALEWLQARPAYPGRERLLAAMRSLSGPAADAGRSVVVEWRLEGGAAAGADERGLRVRLLLRGLCFIEVLMAGGPDSTLRPTLSLPAHSQRWAEPGAGGLWPDGDRPAESEQRILLRERALSPHAPRRSCR
jgi:hypothetical protein